MSELLTKSAARNIFYGGSLFFFVIFGGLVAHSHIYARTVSTNEKTLTEAEIEAVGSKIVAEIGKRYGATLRG